MDPKALAALEARNAARYEYLCTCNDEVKLDLLAECLGNRDALNELVDAFIAEATEVKE